MAVSFLLFSRFKKALISSFDEQLQARAFLVAEKTSVQPRIVPLPQGDESFVILYSANHATDTLFEPHAITFVFPSGNDSIAANSGWRSIRVRHSIENGGSIEVIYALPSDVIDKKVHELALLIWIVLPIGCLLSAIIAYRLSSKLIKPVMQVIDLANSINLNNNTVFLKEHETEDELKELIVSFNAIKYSPEETAIEICIQKNLSMQQSEDTTFAIVIKNKIRKDINPQVSDLKNVFYHSPAFAWRRIWLKLVDSQPVSRHAGDGIVLQHRR